MKIRRYTKEDIPDLIKYLEEGLNNTHYSKYYFDEKKVRHLLMGNERNLTFFCNVVEIDGQIAGALTASIIQPMFTHEAYALDHITYIRAEYRSLKAITGLVTSYVAWAKARGVREVRWSQSTGFKMNKFSALARRLGFKQIGTHFNMEI